ncbi:MAG: flagella basal body P-ring formation protein FlgA [Acidobacteriota bacterium]
MHIVAKGLSREEGSVGDTVRVSNISSNKVVFCRIIDAQTVQTAQ